MSTLTATAENTVLKNTYRLLSLSLVWSAIVAGGAIALGIGHIAGIVCMILALVMLFVVMGTANTEYGLFAIFGFTGLMGASVAPIIGHYLSANPMIVVQALVGTAVVFTTLSLYAARSGKDFSFMGGFLMVAIIVVLVAMIANFFLHIPGASIAISCCVILIMSACILYDTSRIIHGGETNYILATLNLYLDILNIFIHLLSLINVLDD